MTTHSLTHLAQGLVLLTGFAPALIAQSPTSIAAQRSQSAQPECALALTAADRAIALQLQREGAYQLPLAAGGQEEQLIFLSLHVVRASDGSGGIPLSQLDLAVQNANQHFAGAGIRFAVPEPIDYIDDDEMYLGMDSQAELDLLRSTNVVPDTINIYFTEIVAVGEFQYCGYSAFTWSPVQGIVMRNSCTGLESNPSTFSHELGHYFDLLHTHEPAFGWECVDGSNCSTAGDQICDTPADPVLSGVVSEACVYEGGSFDVCGSGAPYQPQVSNMMSYAPKLCRTDFTTGQNVRAQATLFNLRPELIQDPGGSITRFCTAEPNSTGTGATLNAVGSIQITDGDLTLMAGPIPKQQFGIFFYGMGQTQLPMGDGVRCVGGELFRLQPVSSGSFGIGIMPLNFESPPEPDALLLPGSTWNFQFWYRDPFSSTSTYNASDALEITFEY